LFQILVKSGWAFFNMVHVNHDHLCENIQQWGHMRRRTMLYVPHETFPPWLQNQHDGHIHMESMRGPCVIHYTLWRIIKVALAFHIHQCERLLGWSGRGLHEMCSVF
jgi:hypothetical protein